jgi:ubiquinone/menaquinone biosynthesis C-methylase UbiE
VKKINLKAYVIPGSCSHCTIRGSYSFWEFKDLYVYQKRLYHKHKNNFPMIYTFLGCITTKFLLWLKILIIIKPLYLKLFPDFIRHLQKELKGYNTVLDLGCGHLSPIYRFNLKFSVGVDIFRPSILESRRLDIHSQYVQGDITNLEFKPGSFDVVLAVDVLQNLSKDEGIKLLQKMKKWAKKKIIIKTPNGFLKQDAYNNNPHQAHLSGWSTKDFKDQRYTVRGISGWKGWQDINEIKKYKNAENYSFLRERISNLTQKIIYYYPEPAYELLVIKKIEK